MPKPLTQLFTRSAATTDLSVLEGMTVRTMTVRAASYNEETRTVEAVMATERVVQVYDWRRGEVIDETLSMRGVDVPDMIPLLDSHMRWELESHLGSIRGIRIEGDQMIGTLHLADDDGPAERALRLIRDGHLTDVSIGYRPLSYTEIQAGESKVVNGKRYTAGERDLRVTSEWQLLECSLVSIGADEAAQLRHQHRGNSANQHRSPNMDKHLLEAIRKAMGNPNATEEQCKEYLNGRTAEERSKIEGKADQARAADEQQAQRSAADDDDVNDPPTNSHRSAPPTGATPPAQPNNVQRTDPQQAAQDAVRAERERITAIRTLAGNDVPEELVRRAESEGWDESRAATEFLQAVRSGRRQTGAPGFIPSLDQRSSDDQQNALAAGFMLRSGLTPERFGIGDEQANVRAAELGDRLRGASVIRMAEEAIRLSGGNVNSLSPEEVWRAAISSANLQYAFTTNVNAQVSANYLYQAGSTAWCEEGSVNDFKSHEDITLGKSSGMKRLPRGGEADHATIDDNYETFRAYRYAEQFSFDDQDAVDDRLDVLNDLVAEMTQEASQIRPQLVWYLILANGTLNDTGALFNSTAVTTAGGHANLGSSTLSIAAIQSAIQAFMKQRIQGKPIQSMPRYLAVPADLAFLARSYIESPQIITTSGTDGTVDVRGSKNVLADAGLQLVSTDYIGAAGVTDPITGTAATGSATNWFLFGDRRTVKVVYLRGQRTPQISNKVEMGPSRYAITYGIKLDIGAYARDFRSMYQGNS